jgi:hypothetical protein
MNVIVRKRTSDSEFVYLLSDPLLALHEHAMPDEVILARVSHAKAKRTTRAGREQDIDRPGDQ